MLTLGPIGVRIIARAAAFPAGAVSTPELLTRLAPDLPPPRRTALLDHLAADVGVRSRSFVASGEHAVDLAIRAGRDVVAVSGLTPRLIAAHVHATSTPARWTGPDAAKIGQALGLSAAFFDVRSGCTGGLWALVEGARLARDTQSPVLVTAADAFSLTFPAGERLLPFAMGDGGAALLLVPDGEAGITRATFGGRPHLADLGTVATPMPPEPGATFVLGGDPVAFGDAAADALATAYQALAVEPGTRTVVTTTRRSVALAVSSDAWLDGLARHGHLGAATPLVALALLGASAGTSALVSAGGGLSFGAVLWREAA